MTSNDPGAKRLAAVLLAAAAMSGFDGGAVGFLLPAVRSATGLDAAAASWLVTGYVLGTLVSIAAMGAAGPRIAALALLRGSLLLSALGAGVATAVDGQVGLVGGRLLQGLGQGPLLPLAATLIAERFPPNQLGRWNGLVSLAYGLAFLVATLGSPWLLALDWRACFVLSAAVAVAAAIAARGIAAAGPRPADAQRSTRASGGWSALLGAPMLAIAAASLATGVGQAMLVWLPSLAIERLGVSAGAASLLMLPMVAAGLAATVLVTTRLDRLGPRRLASAFAAAAVAGVVLVAALPPSLLAFIAGAGALGLGVAGMSGGPLRHAATQVAPPALQGSAQAAVALVTNVGLLAGSAGVGALAAGTSSDQGGLAGSLLTAGTVMAVMLAAVAALPGRRER